LNGGKAMRDHNRRMPAGSSGIESGFTRDELLTNVMIYWVTQSIGTPF
jgi:hypothetical protein